MKKKEITITLGYINIASWKPRKRLFPDWMYKDPEYKEEVKLDGDEIILDRNEEHTLVIDYPLSNPFEHTFITPNEGMNRKNLVKLIVDSYHQIYDLEKRTSKVPAGLIPGMYNRTKTNGTYGIWGHELGDLLLHSISIDEKNVITVGVDS